MDGKSPVSLFVESSMSGPNWLLGLSMTGHRPIPLRYLLQSGLHNYSTSHGGNVMIVHTRSARFAFAITLFLITKLLTGTYSAHALAPTFSSTTNITNGALDPNILINSSNFATDVNKFGFIVDMGTTGLTFDSAAFVNSTRVRINLRGTAQSGSISIQGTTAAFNPVADNPSNTLNITVPDPLIAQTISFDAFT